MNQLVFLVIVSLILTGCEPWRHEKTFLIRKGQHYCSNKAVESLQSETLEFYATFDQSAVYDLGSESLQTNKNKLLGFSDCNATHHENSARFAWQWFNGKLEIYAYCYVNGNRSEQFIGTVGIGTRNRYIIRRTESHYEFMLNNEQVISVPRGNTCDAGYHYMLWPYFGGSIPAPHDITITIERIY